MLTYTQVDLFHAVDINIPNSEIEDKMKDLHSALETFQQGETSTNPNVSLRVYSAFFAHAAKKKRLQVGPMAMQGKKVFIGLFEALK
jgi:hypothetical protein